MGRSKRWQIPGATYHVMNRGNRKARIYEDDRDRKRFVRLLTEARQKHEVEILHGCQMGSHFHLTILTPHGNLSEFMRDLQGRFARYSNWRHGRIGHLFQGRFRGVIIENDIHLFTVAAYIYNNPVAAGYVDRPEAWKWSSYSATVGLVPLPEYLSISWIETLFPATSLAASQKLLRDCMDNPKQVVSYLNAVDPAPEASIRSYISERLRTVDQPCSLRKLVRPPLDRIFASASERNELAEYIREAHKTHEYTLAEIARHTGLPGSTVSRFCRRIAPSENG